MSELISGYTSIAALTAFAALFMWVFSDTKSGDRQAAGVALYCWAWPVLLIALLWKTKTWAFSAHANNKN